MTIEIFVPPLGESVAEAVVARWLKNIGDTVAVDEPIAELETDKVTLEVPAPKAGVITAHSVAEGATVTPQAVLAILEQSASAGDKQGEQGDPAGGTPPGEQGDPADNSLAVAQPVHKEDSRGATPPQPSTPPPPPAPENGRGIMPLSPAVRRLITEHNLNAAAIPASGKDGRLTKGDVLDFISTTTSATPASTTPVTPAGGASSSSASRADDVREERIPMTRLRRVIAQRLKDAQNTAAMLTTFNEVDMSQIIALRAEHKEAFEKAHGVRLGFMSFFVKAVIIALKDYPAVNAEIDGSDIIYKNYYNIGVAVGTPQGLVVPVLKDADKMSFAETEAAINQYGIRARDGQLSMGDLSGGSFTISNGGVYGSMMSTPILNPPQSGILGMHNIQKRAVVLEGKGGDSIEIRPMMYLALSYDHRIIDGREAVSFLVRIKSMIEDPRRLLLGL